MSTKISGHSKCVASLAFQAVFIFSATNLQGMVLDETHPIRLSQEEQQLLESKACRENFNIGAERIVARKQAPQDSYAEVLCQPHTNYKDNPIHHVVYCDKVKTIWQCERSEQAIRLATINGSLVYFENDIDVETVYNIAQMLASSGLYQGEKLPDLRESTCSIRRHSSFDNVRIPDVLVTTCEHREIFISTWCPQKECPRIIGTRKMMP